MPQDRPTLFPRWATDPPAAPPTTITEPTAAQKDSGWQPSGSAEFPEGKPVREIANWLQNLHYQWSNWLDQSKHSIEDLSNPQVLPIAGTAPSTGAGLIIAAADFSAAVYAGDTEVYRVPLTDGPAHTYAPNSDTYWDLRRDGTWIATPVAAMAAAPAVPTNATRVFAVRTDATDRTSVILDNMSTRTHLWLHEAIRSIGDLMVAGQLEIGAQADDEPPGALGSPPDFNAFIPRVIGTGRGLVGEILWQIAEFGNETGGPLIFRVYVGVGIHRNQLIMTWGARCTANAGQNWTTDSNATDCFRLIMGGDDIANRLFFKSQRILGIGASTSFAENDWSDQDTSGQSSAMDFEGGLRIGDGLNDDSNPSVNSLPHILHVSRTSGSGSIYTLLRQYNETGTEIIREYVAHNHFSGAPTHPAKIKTFNAFFNEDTGLWNRDNNAINSHMFANTLVGRTQYIHRIADPNTWGDGTAATEWTVIDSVGPLLTQLNAISNVNTVSGFSDGFYHGYGSPRIVRRMFTAMHGQISSGDQAANDAVFQSMDPGIVVNAQQVDINAPSSRAELAIPFMMPHESTITAVEVLAYNNGAGVPNIGVWRDDLNNLAGQGAWQQMQSGGDDATIASSVTRIWHTVAGLDTGLTVDNTQYRYAVVCWVPIGASQAFIQAVRVTANVPYISALM